MRSRFVRRVLLVGCLTAGAAVALGKLRLERATNRRIEALLAAATLPSDRPYRSDAIQSLPAPVRRYFETVLPDGQPHVRSVRLEQEGEFRLGGRSGSWKPMAGTQHYTVDPPGFVWDADVEIAPVLSTRVVDAYESGRGSLRALLLSTIPVAEADPGPEMNEGELMRYLGEAVWFPTALLPAADVEWESIDDRSARATIEDRGVTASLVFHFDDEGLVERVSASERYLQEADSVAPWTGYFGEYRRHDGVRIPTEASVEWNLADGDLPYWRARVTSVDYRY